MDIFGIGVPEILVILVIAMIAVGPDRMVKFASEAGRFLRQFRQSTDEVTKEFREAFTLEISEEEPSATEGKPEAAKGVGTTLPSPAVASASQPPAGASVATEGGLPKPASTSAQPEPAAGAHAVPGAAPAPSLEAVPAPSPEPVLQAAAPLPVEEPVPLSDLLGSAFGFDEPEPSPEPSEEPSEAPAGAASASVEELAPTEVGVVGPPAPEEGPSGPTEDAPAPEQQGAAEEIVAEPAPTGQAAEAPEDGHGLNAPIPTFGFDWDQDEAAEAGDPAREEG